MILVHDEWCKADNRKLYVNKQARTNNLRHGPPSPSDALSSLSFSCP